MTTQQDIGKILAPLIQEVFSPCFSNEDKIVAHYTAEIAASKCSQAIFLLLDEKDKQCNQLNNLSKMKLLFNKSEVDALLNEKDRKYSELGVLLNKMQKEAAEKEKEITSLKKDNERLKGRIRYYEFIERTDKFENSAEPLDEI